MDMREHGPMAIAYRQGGHDHLSGGWTAAEVEAMRPDMEAVGCTIIRVYDGVAEARAKFPPGARVVASRKHWKSQVGTVVTDAEVELCGVNNCPGHGWRWDNVPVRFDGDEGVLGWWPSGLEVITNAAGEAA